MCIYIGFNFFIARSGAPVFIKKHSDKADGVGMVVNGGMQVEINNDEYPDNNFDCVVTNSFDMTRGTNEYGNGRTYFINRPMQPSLYNVWETMNNHAEYKAFFDLCKDLNDNASDIIEALFKPADYDESDSEQKELWENEQKKYQIFSTSERGTANTTRLIRFFNYYRYTISVPPPEAL